MKREGFGTPIIVALVVVLSLVVAIGAALQGQLSFAGPAFTPGGLPELPVAKATPHIQPPATGVPRIDNQNTVFGWGPIITVLIILGIAVVALLVWLYVRYRPRRRVVQSIGGDADLSALEADEPGAADLPTLRRGLSRAAEVLGSEREPRDAIVRAWIGLQEAAEDSGMSRRAAETPTEFTTRVFTSVSADRTAADTLLRLYLRVRFGTSPATASDVILAQGAVETLSATWPAGAPR